MPGCVSYCVSGATCYAWCGASSPPSAIGTAMPVGMTRIAGHPSNARMLDVLPDTVRTRGGALTQQRGTLLMRRRCQLHRAVTAKPYGALRGRDRLEPHRTLPLSEWQQRHKHMYYVEY